MMNNFAGTERVNQSDCPRFCPGCHDPFLLPAERLAEKEQYIKKILSPWQDRITVTQEASPGRRLGYREKVCLVAECGEEGWRFGFIKQQTLIPVHHCPIHSPRVNSTLNMLAGILPSSGQFPLAYYLQSGAQVALVIKTRHMPDTSWLNDNAMESFRKIGCKGLWLHLHPAAGRRVTAKSGWHLLWGEPRSTDRQGLAYGPTAFQQLIPELAEAALDEAEAFLAPGPDDVVLDLYCGIGSSLRRWARQSRRVFGVEINGESVECARVNVPSATILRGTGRHRLPQLAALLAHNAHQRLLYVNPPRTGIEPEVLDWIDDVLKPSRIACLSCNAVSLKKDLEQLACSGYRVRRIIPFDFFPGTRYLEMMVLLMAS